jgi:hypothetical protein
MKIENISSFISRLSLWSLCVALVCAIVGLVTKYEIFAIVLPISLFSMFISALAYRLLNSMCRTLAKTPTHINVAIILGFLYIVFVLVVVLIGRRRFLAEKAYSTLYNLRLLDKSLIGYAKNNNGYLPDANQWCDLLMRYDKTLTRQNFKHPLIKEWECNIAFNKNLSCLKLSEIPKDTVLLFEADGGWNLSGDMDLLQKRYNNRKDYYFCNVLLIDGSIKTYQFERGGYRYFDSNGIEFLKPLHWKP